LISVLYSDNLKLSVEAKVTFLSSILTRIQARVGLMFHSADENKVFSIDFLITLHSKVKDKSSLIFGIKGKSEAIVPLIFIFHSGVLICILSSLNNSISKLSSVIREI